MNLKQRIAEEMKQALKSGERETLAVLRMLRSRILEREVSLRAERGREYELSDEETLAVLSSYARQRRQSIESYRQAGRSDLVAREEAELEIVQRYLPRQLSDVEIDEMVGQAIQESGATGIQEMGRVMSLLMPRLRGAADGKRVSAIVRRRLGG